MENYKQKNFPLISIITVTYNARLHLEGTILSVINQTKANIEYIIIDGGSNDGTVEIIKKYESKISYWISEPDKGIYDAMNKGIANSSGVLIGIVNAGDRYELDIIRVVSDLYLKKQGIIHGNLNLYRNGKLVKCDVKPDLNINHLCNGMTFFHPTYFVPKSVYQKIGCFSINNIIASDYEFTIKAIKAGIPFHYLDLAVSNFDMDGISNKKALLSFKESYRIAAKYGYPLYLLRINFIRKCISYWSLNTPGIKIIYNCAKHIFRKNGE